ncbi:MAG: hypothetical protein IJB59_14690, partial [Oscillospiraceae bacterium]|nr:hypothetical protein [Oscillospiraceae bacterium]
YFPREKEVVVMQEPIKEQFGDGQDNFGQAAAKASEAARQFSEISAAKGTEMAVNSAAASVQAGLEGGSAVANVAAGTAAGGPWGAVLSAAGPCVTHYTKYLFAYVYYLL